MQLDQRLLGPVPYVGGDIQAEVGLFSVASGDLTGPYLKLLDLLSQAATVSFIGLALPFVEPIKQGINALRRLHQRCGTGDRVLHDVAAAEVRSGGSNPDSGLGLCRLSG